MDEEIQGEELASRLSGSQIAAKRRRKHILLLPEPKELDLPMDVNSRLMKESSYHQSIQNRLPEEDSLLGQLQVNIALFFHPA